MTMATEAGTQATPSATLLQLLWLASPALPVGGFSYSEGLEAAVDSARVHDEQSASAWLSDQLELTLARADLPVLRAAHQAWADDDAQAVQALNDWVLATRETRELRLQAEQMGRSLAQWLAQRLGGEDARVQALHALPGGPTWPVAFALAVAQAGASPRDALLAGAFSWAENQVQAAIKCVPLGQSAGQRILGRLALVIESAVAHVLQAAPDQRQAFAPGLAILSSRHEQQYSRLFRS